MNENKCNKHPGQILRNTKKEYCPICEGFFSAHGFGDILSCPFKFNAQKIEERDKGRAFPLIKGKTSHFVAEVFNSSLSYIPKETFESQLSSIFDSFRNFLEYISMLLGDTIVRSTAIENYSFYLYKKEMFDYFLNENILFNMIPLVTEEWLFIPFNLKQYFLALQNGVKLWTKIGIHNVLDEVFMDVDGKAICIDYKSYPRKGSRIIREIRSKEKKYQLITALFTFEYNYGIEVKYVANVDLGTSEFPNISYYHPTSRGLLYYKKALLESYKTFVSKNFYPKFTQFSCLNFCDYKDICTHPEIKKWRKLKDG